MALVVLPFVHPHRMQYYESDDWTLVDIVCEQLSARGPACG